MERNPEIPHISVTGTSRTKVDPDFAQITVELKCVTDDASEGKTKVDAQSAAVIQLARECGVLEPEITATQLEIGPEYDWRSEGNSYKGTSISREVSVVLRDLDKFSQILQGLADVPVFRLANVEMDTSNRQAIEKQTLDAAIQDAKESASQIAQGLGLTITGVYRASPGGSRHGRGAYYAMASLDTQDSFEVGRIEISSEIDVIFHVQSSSPTT